MAEDQQSLQPQQVDMEDSEILRFTQRLRRNLVDELTKGNKMPDDPKDRQALLQTMADMDRTVLSKLKIQAVESSTTEDKRLTNVLRGVLSQLDRVSQAPIDGSREAPRLDNTIDVEFTEVTGETAIGISDERSEDFQNRMEERRLLAMEARKSQHG